MSAVAVFSRRMDVSDADRMASRPAAGRGDHARGRDPARLYDQLTTNWRDLVPAIVCQRRQLRKRLRGWCKPVPVRIGGANRAGRPRAGNGAALEESGESASAVSLCGVGTETVQDYATVFATPLPCRDPCVPAHRQKPRCRLHETRRSHRLLARWLEPQVRAVRLAPRPCGLHGAVERSDRLQPSGPSARRWRTLRQTVDALISSSLSNPETWARSHRGHAASPSARIVHGGHATARGSVSMLQCDRDRPLCSPLRRTCRRTAVSTPASTIARTPQAHASYAFHATPRVAQLLAFRALPAAGISSLRIPGLSFQSCSMH